MKGIRDSKPRTSRKSPNESIVKLKRWLIWLLVISLFLFTVFIIVSSFMMPAGSFEVLGRLESNGIVAKEITIEHNDSLTIGGFTFGDSAKSPLLLVHGSPGDWSAWENVISNETIQSNYFIIAIDRPGYGGTIVPAQTDLQNQSATIWSVIENLNLNEIVVVGHSYGGAVVEQLLVDDQSYFKAGILVAATASPILMSPRWYNKIASWGLVKAILPKDLLSSNIEMMGLPRSLDLIENKLKDISTPIVFIQGGKDVLVPSETTDYFKQVKPKGVEYILPEEVNHFIPWSEPCLINDVLINIKANEN